MDKPQRDQSPPKAGGAESKAPRRWRTPVLVEYGHLAKLTRSGSGGFVESGGMMKTRCL